ncbi:radical SAM protein [Thermodesulfobacteriota bacterium]
MEITADELARRVEFAKDLLRSCMLCPRRCRVDRTAGETGFCGMGADLVVSSWGPHFGEEPELVGTGGSGTIFLTGCSLGCIFCQNYDISRLRQGRACSAGELALAMVALQDQGCHNINFVTPTHCVPQILEAIALARDRGLSVPVVYNCGGYENPETLRLLDGVVDIYMPDAKFADRSVAQCLSDAPDYFEVLKAALLEMHRQVGDLVCTRQGIAVRGLLVRHLVLPGGMAGTGDVLAFISTEISKETYVNIMTQYRPMYRASEVVELDRLPTGEELSSAFERARELGLKRGF